MVSLAGASAAYPGFLSAAHQSIQNDAGELQNQNARIEQMGNEALGNTIKLFQQQVPGSQPMQPPMGGGAPQPPMPGQPSQPMQQGFQPQSPAAQPQMQVPPPGAAPPQQAGPAPAAAPQAPGMQSGGQPVAGGDNSFVARLQGKLDLKTLMGAIAHANPDAKPAVIAAAVTKALPLLNAQAAQDWKQMSMSLAAGRLQNAQEGTAIRGEEADRKQTQGTQRLDQGQQRIDQQGGEFASRDVRRQAQTDQGAQRIDQNAQREQRLAAQSQIRQDQRWAQLEQQKQSLAARIQQGGDRTALSQWRAIVDAQHKRATEIIQSNSINATLPPEEKKALLKEQNDFYKSEIEAMRKGPARPERPAGADTTTAPAAPKDQSQVAPVQATADAGRPRAKNPKTGEELEFDGKAWVPVAPVQ